MGLKLSRLAAGILAATAVSALAVGDASGKITGHFVQPPGSTTRIAETSGTSHAMEFTSHGTEGGIICEVKTYSTTGTATGTKVEETTTVTYHKCRTRNGQGTFSIHSKCHMTFKSATAGLQGTTQITCPQGVRIQMTHPNCTIEIPAQTIENSVTYTTITESGKHAITLDVNAQVSTQYESGICVFLGTSHTGTFTGSLIMTAVDETGNPVDITAT